jgi:hypothetical protein
MNEINFASILFDSLVQSGVYLILEDYGNQLNKQLMFFICMLSHMELRESCQMWMCKTQKGQ